MEKLKKVIFIQPHPIHWFSSQFKFIAKNATFDFEVYYCTKHGLNNQIDSGFGKRVDFKIPLLEGYNFKFLKNYSFNKNHSDTLFSSVNFDIIPLIFKSPKETLFLVHGWSRFTYLLTIFFGKILGRKIGLRAESPITHERKYSKTDRKLRKIIFKYILFPNIDFFFYIGSQNKYFYKYYGVKENKLKFYPYCVDNEFFRDKFKNNKKSKKHISGVKKILFVGKLIPKKAPETLIKAFLKLDYKRAKLIIVGDGILYDSLNKKYINEIKSGQIELKGFQDQNALSKFYSNADIFVLPSGYGETWGLVVNEACNFELPLILSDKVGCSTDLVKGNGYIFKYGDIDDLSNKLQLLLKNTNLKTTGKISNMNLKNLNYTNILKTLENLKLN